MKYVQQLILITALTFLWSSQSITEAEVVVIVNSTNNATITDSDIKRLFLGKMKKFPGGGTALPINLDSSSDTRTSFEKKALGKSGSQIKAYWSKLVFSGKGQPPKEVATDKNVIDLVKDNPAVIGYVDSESVGDGVKIVGKF